VDNHVDVTNKRVAVLGLAFKPGTDDVRNSRTISVIEVLQQHGGEIDGYGLIAAENMLEVLPGLENADKPEEALDGAASLVVINWEEIIELDEEFDAMATPVVVDGRCAISRRDGIVYEGLTW
jgi:UDPglucose 6-dehydrogenase